MSKLVKCRTCGQQIASSAKTCPHCGAKQKRTGCCGFVVIAVILIFAVGMFLVNSPEAKKRQQEHEEKQSAIMETSLAYLGEVPEISEYRVVGDEVHIVLKSATAIPHDYDIICNAAASNASREAGQTCHAYLFLGGEYTPDKSKALYECMSSNGISQYGEDTEYGAEWRMKSMSEQQKAAYQFERQQRKNSAAFAQKFKSSWDGSIKPVVRFAKANMHDPSSFEHVGTSWGPLRGTLDHYLVTMKFRGKNALGAVVLNELQVEIDLNGNIVRVVE